MIPIHGTPIPTICVYRRVIYIGVQVLKSQIRIEVINFDER